MSKTAYMFPGQGCQYKGMGKDLFESYPDYVRTADEILGYSIEELCLKDPNNCLNNTFYTQPAIYIIEVLSYLARMETSPTKPDFLLGHSLGEYTALFAAGCFDFASGLKLVCERARLMSQSLGGGMAALRNIETNKVKKILSTKQFDCIDIANLNTPNQVVLSGDKDQLSVLADKVIEAGGQFYPLKVSGAFHSRYMQAAQESFQEFLNNFSVLPPKIPVISNVTGIPYPMESDAIKVLLLKQITSAVHWVDSICYLYKTDVSEFIEVGPGTILSRMLSEIPPKTANSVLHNDSSLTLVDNPGCILLCPGIINQKIFTNRVLTQENTSFQHHFKSTNELIKELTGESVDTIIATAKTDGYYQKILHNYVVHFSIGVSSGFSIKDQNENIKAYVGWGIGEYITLVLSEVLSLGHAIQLLKNHADNIEKNHHSIKSLVIESNVNIFYGYNKIFNRVKLSGILNEREFCVTGDKESVEDLQTILQHQGISCYVIHPEQLVSCDIAEKTHNISEIKICPPNKPVYSSAFRDQITELSTDRIDKLFRSRYNKKSTLQNAKKAFPDSSLCNIFQES